MKKRNLFVLAGLCLAVSVSAQTLYLPNGTNAIGYSTSGHVGIGIQYAQQKLTIYDGNVLISPGTNTANGFMGKYCFSPGSGYFVDPSAYIGGVFEGGIWYNGSALVFATSPGPDITSANNTVERMRINRYGNVGIGTSSPNNKLHLNTPSGSIAMTLQTGGSYGYVVNDGNSVILASDQGLTGFKLLVNRLAPDNSMIINSSGNVGIGISSPNSQLHLASDGDHSFRITRASGMYGFRIYRNASEGNIYFQNTDNDNNFGTRIKIGEGGTNWQNLYLNPDGGNVGIGTTDPQTKLHVNGDLRVDGEIYHRGTLKSKQIKVEMPTGEWKDYVFDRGYKLMALPEVEQFINQHKHLPEVPSSAEVEKNGLDIGEFQAKLLQKVEELTLYVIEAKKENTELKQKIKELEELIMKK